MNPRTVLDADYLRSHVRCLTVSDHPADRWCLELAKRGVCSACCVGDHHRCWGASVCPCPHLHTTSTTP